MTGAIAAVSCANSSVIHLVCVRSDGYLSHAIGAYDKDKNLTWDHGNLKGQAHDKSRIAIGCRDATAAVPVLDIIWQTPEGDIVTQTYGEDGFWGDSGSSFALVICPSLTRCQSPTSPTESTFITAPIWLYCTIEAGQDPSSTGKSHTRSRKVNRSYPGSGKPRLPLLGPSPRTVITFPSPSAADSSSSSTGRSSTSTSSTRPTASTTLSSITALATLPSSLTRGRPKISLSP